MALTRAQQADLLLGKGSRFTPSLVEHYLQAGLWRKGDLGAYLTAAAGESAGRPAAISVDAQGRVTRALTYAELDELAERISGGLRAAGVEPGDVVAVMLRNCVEFQAVAFAILRLGAIYSGIPVTYGRREAEFMLRRSATKVLVTVARDRERDLVGMAAEMRPGLDALEHVVVYGGEAPAGPGWSSFAALEESEPAGRLPPVEPFSLAQIGFTSGTTSEPKGVMNLHHTIDAVVRNWVAHIGADLLGKRCVNLVMSPVGHSTGFLWGALMTTLLRGTAVYLERWQPEVAFRVMAEQRVTTTIAAPTFLMDLLRVSGATAENLPDLSLVSVPGAPIPRPMVPRAREQLRAFICPAWGMTELGIGVSGSPTLSQARVEATDGVAVGDCEIAVCRDDDSPAEPGEEGGLQMRGAGLFAGYLARPDLTAEAFTNRGWFRTGDVALIDEDGFISLRGRTKDIIIRGGENIPVIDVENTLYQHPGVVEVTVIGVPDERLGERACAVVVPGAGARLTLADLSDFLLAQGLSKRFLPERLLLVDELPKTMSGKTRKVELRRRFSDLADTMPGRGERDLREATA